ncbi:MAG: tRNA (N6-isopentenyl adenosine(37)-C2)-methylthiotransferase MiaB, partial [Elusimicrobiaceae bacterium]|nr:tRNA (N6-isopentenyl adenosine(37)-C2)-methylthiotransferase MiaB [Elusimicrobiaceae bacterium]
MLKVFIQTYGCQMNEADSEEMFLHLCARGAVRTNQLEEADAVLINTCTVRDHAEHRAISFLGRLLKWKRQNPNRIIIFAGCAAQRLGKKLQKRYPFLNIVTGAKEIEHFSQTLDQSGLFSPAGKPPAVHTGLSAYATIMRGCNFNCTYCIVPTVRGPIKCLPVQDILQDVTRKAQAGAKEIMLLGQTVNSYQDGNTSFADLLNRVSEIPGIERVRFTSPHPIYFTPQFLHAVKDNPKIARHVHMPLQSGSTRVLADMKRGYTREIFLEKVQQLQHSGFEISTDIIVGFPTETEADFEQTLSLVAQARFSAAYCFKYSPRQGTPAARMELLSQNILEKRLDILLNQVRDLAQHAYQRQVGTVQEVLMEEPTKGRSSS